MAKAADITARFTREKEFETHTNAFHFGLKLVEHWTYWRETIVVHQIAELWPKGGSFYDALLAFTRRQRDLFGAEQADSWTLDGRLNERTKRRITDYSRQAEYPQSFSSHMSQRGKTVLKFVYRHITEELDKGDPDGALRFALTDGSHKYITKQDL